MKTLVLLILTAVVALPQTFESKSGASIGGAITGTPSAPTLRDIPSVLDFGADPTGVTNAVSAIAAGITAACATTTKQLLFPGGATFLVDATSGTLISLPSTCPGLKLLGPGKASVTITLPANKVVSSGDITIFQALGDSQEIFGFKIVGAGLSGTSQVNGISVYAGAFRTWVHGNEIVGIYGGQTAGGMGISTYQPWNQAEFSSTLGTTIASGAQTVTPASMAGIYLNRQVGMNIGGGAAEYVTVTAVTATTFTATFANAHNASEAIVVLSDGRQYALVEDNYIHDSFKATGMGINSSNNILRGNKIVNVGSTGTQHGFYMQGGYNLYKDNTVDGIAGYCFHLHKQVATIDGSGDIIDGNKCYDSSVFATIDGVSNVSNPEFASGVWLNRYTTFTNNLCKRRAGSLNSGTGCALAGGAVNVFLDSNTFEDPQYNNSTPMIYVGSGSLVSNTRIIATNITTGTPIGGYVRAGANSVVSNTACIGIMGTCVVTDGTGVQIRGGTVTCGTGLACSVATLNHSGASLSGFTFTSSTAGATALSVANSLTGVEVYGNTFNSSETPGFSSYVFLAGTTTNVNFHNNTCTMANANFYGVRFSGAPSSSLILENNACGVSLSGSIAPLQPYRSGRAIMYTAGDSTGKTKLVKLSAGKMVIVATTDTVFDAVTLSDGMTNTTPMLYTSLPGSEVMIAADGAWVDGNVGIISTTTAGAIHDTGSAQPPAYGISYVRFIGSGSSGTAQCLIINRGVGYVASANSNQGIRTIGAHFTASDFTNGVTKCVLVRFAGTIQESTVNVDVAGAGSTNNVIDIITVAKASWTGPASGSSITASAKPTAGTSLVVTDATLTGWSKSVAADTFVCFVPTSLSNATFEDISVKLTAN